MINGLYCCCGTNESKNEAAVLISNFSAESREYTIRLDNLPLKGTNLCQIYLLDKSRNLELVSSEEIGVTCNEVVKFIGRHSVMLLKIKGIWLYTEKYNGTILNDKPIDPFIWRKTPTSISGVFHVYLFRWSSCLYKTPTGKQPVFHQKSCYKHTDKMRDEERYKWFMDAMQMAYPSGIHG